MLWCFLAAMASSAGIRHLLHGFFSFCGLFWTRRRPISAAPAEPRPKYLSRAIDLRRALCQGLQVKRA